MTYPASPRNAAANRPRPDPVQFWAGAAATAVVAALIALVGILITPLGAQHPDPGTSGGGHVGQCAHR